MSKKNRQHNGQLEGENLTVVLFYLRASFLREKMLSQSICPEGQPLAFEGPYQRGTIVYHIKASQISPVKNLHDNLYVINSMIHVCWLDLVLGKR